MAARKGNNEFGISDKQYMFAVRLHECGNASEAYRHAYKTQRMSANTIHKEACLLADNPKLTPLLEKLKSEAKERSEITVDKKKKWLQEIVERSMQHESVVDKKGEPTGEYKFDASSAVRAINELNKMDGDHAPVKSANTNKDGEDIPSHLTVEYVNAK